MMMSCHGNVFRTTGPFMGLHQLLLDSSDKGPVKRSVDIFFRIQLNKLLTNSQVVGDLRRLIAHDVTITIIVLSGYV